MVRSSVSRSRVAGRVLGLDHQRVRARRQVRQVQRLAERSARESDGDHRRAAVEGVAQADDGIAASVDTVPVRVAPAASVPLFVGLVSLSVGAAVASVKVNGTGVATMPALLVAWKSIVWLPSAVPSVASDVVNEKSPVVALNVSGA